MSTFDDASLVFIPSGYKTSKAYSVKPSDGSGDLAFSRSNDTATRVGPDGLIQRVRTNLLLQSNTFSTTWTLTGAVLTSGQAGYDGTTNAWLLDKNASQGRVTQSISQSGIQTLSVYAKKGTSEFLRMFVNGPNSSIYFNLNDGSVQSSASIVSGKSTDVGGGWYRCEVAFDGTTTAVNIYPAESGSTAGTSGNILIQAAQLETGDIATDYIATTTAAVSVGPVANVPRLDYLNSSCPRLLLEPQRTNLHTFSEQMDNAAWGKTNVSVTANNAVSPDGYTNADKVVANTTNGIHRIEQEKATASQQATQSVFAKASGYDFIAIENGGGRIAYFNISNGVVGTVTNGTASIEDYGNGWYRCNFTATAVNTKSYIYICRADNVLTFAGDNTSGAFIYGAQFEASAAYATSYIPTLGAAVTRGADDINTTFASAFAQSGGAAFIELKGSASGGGSSSPFIRLNGNKAANTYLGFGNTANWRCRIQEDGAAYLFTSSVAKTSDVKLCVSYSSTGWAMFANGVKFASGSEDIDLGGIETITSSIGDTSGSYEIKQMILFPTPLSDADAIALTA